MRCWHSWWENQARDLLLTVSQSPLSSSYQAERACFTRINTTVLFLNVCLQDTTGSSFSHQPLQERGPCRLQSSLAFHSILSDVCCRLGLTPEVTPADKKPFLWPNKALLAVWFLRYSSLLFFFLLLPSYKKRCLLSISRRKPEQLGAFPS